MNVKFELTGPSEATIHFIDGLTDNVRRVLRQTFFQIGRDLKRKTNADILDKTTKTGHIYYYKSKSGRRLKHRASAPGQTHANLTGALRRSIGWKVHGTDHLEFGYGLTRPTTAYARRIEFGGMDARGTMIEERPSLRNNIAKIDVVSYFDRAVRTLEGK
jgi:hypothetical protein